jgi:hypothetical protein
VSQAADYRLLYGDLTTGTIGGELPVESFNFTLALNAPGSLKATLPLDNLRSFTLPGQGLRDEFDRPDAPTTLGTAPTGQTWTQLSFFGGALGIQSGQAYASTTDAAALIAHTSGSADGTTTAVLDTSGAAGKLGVLFRFDVSSFNAWQLIFIGGTASLLRIDGGSPAGTETSTGYVDGAVVAVRIVHIGPRISVYLDGSLAFTVEDEAHQDNTGVGFTLNNATSRIESIVCEPADYETVTYNPLGPGDLDAWRTALYVDRDGSIVWAGVVIGVRAEVQSNAITLDAKGFHEYFNRRFLLTTADYLQVDQTEIAADLINDAQGIAGGDIAIDTSLVAPTGVLRDRLFNDFERKNLGEAINQLAALDDGFDFRYESRWESGSIVTYFITSYPPAGRSTDFTFELGTNVELMNLEIDGTDLANRIDVVGAGEGQSMPIGSAADVQSLTAYPLLQDVLSENDLTDPALLAASARFHLTRAAAPLIIPSLTALGNRTPTFGSYLVGDIVRVKGSYGFIDLNSEYRITVLDVRVDNLGQESVDITLAPVELFERVQHG